SRRKQVVGPEIPRKIISGLGEAAVRAAVRRNINREIPGARPNNLGAGSLLYIFLRTTKNALAGRIENIDAVLPEPINVLAGPHRLGLVRGVVKPEEHRDSFSVRCRFCR